jgi:hypothetical protein
MAPAGEMWSVVTESPTIASTRASRMLSSAPASRGRSSKNGGLRTYVDCSSHAKREPPGAGSAAQRSSPVNTSAYSERNISCCTLERTTDSTSACEGQMSRR